MCDTYTYTAYTCMCIYSSNIVISGFLVVTNAYQDLLALRIMLRSPAQRRKTGTVSDDKTTDCGDTRASVCEEQRL